MDAPVRTTATDWLNPAVLKWAREWRGFSLEDAAGKMKKAPEEIASWESGVHLPTVRQARTLMAHYDRGFLELFLSEPPSIAIPIAVPDYRMVAGQQSPERSHDLERLLGWVEAQRDNALELFRDRGETPPSIPAELRSSLDESPESAAFRSRDILGFSMADQMAMTRSEAESLPKRLRGWIEQCGILTFRETGLKGIGARGICLAVTPLPVIVFGTESPTAQVFTLTHELGHILLRESGITGQLSRENAVNPIERWCNAFAAAFLIPSDLVFEILGVSPERPSDGFPDDRLAEVARIFRVSPQAMLIRLVHLGYVSSDYYWNVKRPQFQEAESAYRSFGRPRYYASRYRSQYGDLYARLVIEAWTSGRLSSHSAAEYFGMKRPQYVEDLRREFEAA